MHKRFLPVLVSIIILFSTSNPSFAAYSPQDAISQNKIKFVQMNDKILKTNSDISNLNIEMDKLNSVMRKNDSDIGSVVKAINAAEAKSIKLGDEIKTKQGIADSRLRAMYKLNTRAGYLSMILTSKDLSDFFTRLEAIRRITILDKKVLEDLKDRKDDLNKNIADLDSEKQKLQELKDSQLASLAKLDTEKKELVSLVAQFDSEKKEAAAIIKENEEKLVAHAISVINLKSTTIYNMKSAISTLRSLMPQLNTASVKEECEKYISEGTSKLNFMIAENEKLSRGDGSNSDTYKATFSMSATAYTTYSSAALTAMGLKPVRDPSGLSTIAVDPDVIPLGSKVYIPGYGYAIASDTGSAIQGNKIDLYFNTLSECIQWGRRNIMLYVIAYPGEW